MSIQIDLNGTWKLTWCELDGCDGVPRCSAPIDAAVPGDVHLDLVSASLLPEPLVGANFPKHAWVERALFSYERELSVEASFDRAELVFDGIDCLAEVFLDDMSIGSSANAFVPHTLDVTEVLRSGQIHKLKVNVETGVEWGKKQDLGEIKKEANYERSFLRKSQFSFGWDWAPRLVTCGIWRDVSLKLYKHAAIRDVRLSSSFDGDAAELTARVSMESFDCGDCLLKLRVVRGAGVWQTTQRVDLREGMKDAELTVRIDPVERWYPAGFGDQALYSVEVELERAGEIIDDHATTYGFREIAIKQTPNGDGEKNFIINVNGTDIFCKGANWVPADSLYVRVTEAKYEALTKEAVEANFNMLRIWGGGIYEDKAFYDLCDRYGLMIWHDFMFACAEYPEWQESYAANVKDEAEKVVRLLRDHPSIALWCGNNENQWMFSWYGRGKDGRCAKCYGDLFYEEVLPEVCGRLDPQRPYWPGSPYSDGICYPNSEALGDRHSWEVSIHGKEVDFRSDVRNYRKDRGKFISEYGVLSYALPQSILQYTQEDTLDFTSEAYALHDNTFNVGNNPAEPVRPSQTDHYLRFAFGSVPEDGLTYINQSLAYQAMGYREAISDFRIRKFGCAGSLFWMYSDCWGTHGWTIVDYYLRRKPSFYWVRKAYAPVAAFVQVDDGIARTFVVNDSLQELTVKLTLEVGDLAGKCVSGAVEDIVVPANGVARGPDLGCGSGYAFVQIEGQEGVLSDDLILTHFPSEMEVPETELSAEMKQVGDETEVTLASQGFGHFVWLDLPDGAVASDNWFNLRPLHPKTVRVSGASAEQIGVQALNAKS